MRCLLIQVKGPVGDGWLVAESREQAELDTAMLLSHTVCGLYEPRSWELDLIRNRPCLFPQKGSVCPISS
jgi:hypothetical protein